MDDSSFEKDFAAAQAASKNVPFRSPPGKDISRKEAQRRAVSIFGPRAFCRKATKSNAPNRCEVGLRKTVPPFQVVVRGVGGTWKDATEDAVTNVEDGIYYAKVAGFVFRVRP